MFPRQWHCEDYLHSKEVGIGPPQRIRKEISQTANKGTGCSRTPSERPETRDKLMNRTDKYVGSDLDDYLQEEGLLESSQSVAIKRVLSWQIAQYMQDQTLSKAAMAARMNTSRSALDRLLNPDNESVTLKTLQNAARAINARLEMKLVLNDKAA